MFDAFVIIYREDEGRQLLGECLLITEKYKGNKHPNLVTHLINLATSYSRSKNYAEAERLLRSGLQIMRKTVELNEQSISVPMLHLAVTLYHLRQDDEAEHLASEVVRIREEAFGKNSLLVGKWTFFILLSEKVLRASVHRVFWS